MISSIHEKPWFFISLAFVALLLGFTFSDGLNFMVGRWEKDEYSHGYLIPVISFWFVWQNKQELRKFAGRGSWAGAFVVMSGLFLGLLGELATLYVITQYAFLITLFGLCLSYVGWKGVRFLWFPLLYLVFMIPLPNFLYNSLSSQLQLISSQIGVAVIRLFDISVYLEGNVIDLGNYQLQVVEACNGLRYLFPLASFGFLCAYLFRAKLWMRIIVFVSTLPITVLMNSFRIGVIGILVEYWGIEQAEGFLHDFEGWIIFVGCLGILFFEMWLLVRLFMRDKSFAQVFVVDAVATPANHDGDIAQQYKSGQATAVSGDVIPVPGFPKPYFTACLLLLLAVPITMLVGDRNEIKPERQRFATFPLHLEEWRGVEVGMGQKYIDTLKFDDYIIGNFTREDDFQPVNFYVAYYASQRKGASAHSPKSCIPGDGWRIGDFEQHSIPSATMGNGELLRVNRAVISKGRQRQLVYYWFQQRGRIITNEYLVKWFLFWDALTRQRTDGALVRLVIALPDGSDEVEADKKLEDFLRVVFPKLVSYVPD